MNKKALIELVDGAIVNIETFQDYVRGCDTCDYGSSYTTDIEICYRNKSKDIIQDNSMYSYGISMSDFMKVILNNQDEIKKLKECEVAEFLKEKLENEGNCYGLKIKK